jgi:hypothetical protein
MATDVDICNMALSYLGVRGIITLQDTSQTANKCTLFYESIRDQVLRDHPWNFAEKRASLTLLTSVTPIGYDLAYQYPADCLKIRRLHQEVTTDTQIDYRVTSQEDAVLRQVGRMILTNEADAKAIYTAKITVENLFDSSFIKAFSLKLAAEMAPSLQGKLDAVSTLTALYTKELDKAEASDATEQEFGTEALLLNTTFTDARS